MPKNPTPSRGTTTVTLTLCFALGVGGAYSGGALATRHAVAEAHAAAYAVNAELTALEETLTTADASLRAAAFAHDNPAVATAVAAVSKATESAQSTTQAHTPVLTSATATTPTLSASPTDGAAEPSHTTNQARASAPPSSTPAVDEPEPPMPDPTKSRSDTTPALPDRLVEVTLEGTPDSTEQAQEATARLEQARQDIDHARTRVEDQVAALDHVRLAAKHDKTLERLNTLITQTPELIDSVTSAVDDVGLRVTNPGVIDTTEAAVAALQSTLATAHAVNRDSAQQVKDLTLRLKEARAVTEQRARQLRATHEEWIDQQNATIRQNNQVALTSHDTAVQKAQERHREANREQARIHDNGWSGRPEGVSGSNGRLAQDTLCELDFAPGHSLQCDAAYSLMAANAQYKEQTGKSLHLTDSYRSYSLQVRTRAVKPRTAARPGTSNHGWGMAVDMDRHSAQWLTVNGADFGWVHPAWARSGGVRPEWWHLEYVATEVGSFQEPALTGVSDVMVSVFDPEYKKSDLNADNTQLTRANVDTD